MLRDPIALDSVADQMLRNGTTEDVSEIIAPEFSEEALALRFSTQHAENLRYVAAWNRWMIWDGQRWCADSTLSVFDRARAICREAASETSDARLASRIAQANTVAAVERLVRSDRRHAAIVEQWDAHPWLLNTPGGVVNLGSGQLRPARRDDYMTKMTKVAPGGQCPLWHTFLNRVVPDRSLQAFLKRMCGYALTGWTREHAVFFLYGLGANGKSVFVQTLCGLLGDYARVAPIEMFLASKNEHHPTDVAGLLGARLVTAVETEDGRNWAESKLKALTGGDKLTARFMRQDYFDFMPNFKLVIAGNHRPGLRTIDEAIRRRLHLVPFTVTVPAQERDKELAERLRAEWSGILQWAVDGCLVWQADGLSAPDCVRHATDEYLAGEDTLARFLDDECVVRPGSWTSGRALFDAWTRWCEQNREHVGSQKKFSQTLEAKGFPPKRLKPGGKSTRGFENIELRRDA